MTNDEITELVEDLKYRDSEICQDAEETLKAHGKLPQNQPLQGSSVVAAAILKDQRLSALAKLAYGLYAVSPQPASLKDLAEQLGTTERHARRIVSELSQYGLIAEDSQARIEAKFIEHLKTSTEECLVY
jgi:predicted transcriptional regulator